MAIVKMTEAEYLSDLKIQELENNKKSLKPKAMPHKGTKEYTNTYYFMNKSDITKRRKELKEKKKAEIDGRGDCQNRL